MDSEDLVTSACQAKSPWHDKYDENSESSVCCKHESLLCWSCGILQSVMLLMFRPLSETAGLPLLGSLENFEAICQAGLSSSFCSWLSVWRDVWCPWQSKASFIPSIHQWSSQQASCSWAAFQSHEGDPQVDPNWPVHCWYCDLSEWWGPMMGHAR